MTQRSHRRRLARRTVAIAVAAAVLVGAAPGSSLAYWRASTTAPAVTVSAGTVTPPATIDCDNAGSLLNASARVSWPAADAPARYEVTISYAGGAQSRLVDEPFIVINAGLLGGLAGLLSPGTLQVSVKTVRSGWTSPDSSPQQPVAYTVLPLGARCA